MRERVDTLLERKEGPRVEDLDGPAWEDSKKHHWQFRTVDGLKYPIGENGQQVTNFVMNQTEGKHVYESQ